MTKRDVRDNDHEDQHEHVDDEETNDACDDNERELTGTGTDLNQNERNITRTTSSVITPVTKE